MIGFIDRVRWDFVVVNNFVGNIDVVVIFIKCRGLVDDIGIIRIGNISVGNDLESLVFVLFGEIVKYGYIFLFNYVFI